MNFPHKIPMGSEVKCIMTGLQGCVASYNFTLTGMIQYDVRPMGDGTEIKDGRIFDENLLDVVGPGISARALPADTGVMVGLGDTVEDTVTGVQGITTDMVLSMNGCVYFYVQPRAQKDGKLPDSLFLSHRQLKVVKAAKKAEPETRPSTGGPLRRANPF